jgi:diguanylate cyclase (GGDEF)-like protein
MPTPAPLSLSAAWGWWLQHPLAWLLTASTLLLLVALALALWRLHRVARSRETLRSQVNSLHSALGQLQGRDTVTGLMTRPEFEQVLDSATLAADRSDTPLALLYLGLDDFRPMNEGYGHRVGDAVLREAAQRLAAFAGRPLGLSRVGGDEFALLLPQSLAEAGHTAQRALQALQRPYAVDGLELHLGASVGIAVYPDHGSRPRLLPHAALAMRSVKQVGGRGHAVYDPALAVDQREQAELLQALRHAVERGELQLVYQPKVDARSLQITAAEALVRWQHPQRGTVSPAVFIPLAERHGLITAIGRWVFEEACRQAAQWRQQGLRMRVAVNLSSHQLRQEDFVEHLQATLLKHAIPPGRLTVEITESVAMEDTEHTRAAFERLGRAGLHVSIDDFGTGHSSLAALRRLPAAELKIDRAFITDLAHSESARSIVQAVVQMAQTLSLRVVAEGVETEAQRDALVALGCDELQGFLFARPMSPTALALWAHDDRPGGDAASDGARAGFRPSLFAPTTPAPMD